MTEPAVDLFGPVDAGTLLSSGRRLAAYAALERALFELTGRWSTDPTDGEVAAWFATVSLQHAWHAELFSERVPDVPGVDTTPPASVVALARALDAGAPVLRLTGLVMVALPATVVSLRRHLDLVSPVSDGPAQRALKLVLADHRAAREEGEALLADRLGPETVDGVFAHARNVAASAHGTWRLTES